MSDAKLMAARRLKRALERFGYGPYGLPLPGEVNSSEGPWRLNGDKGLMTVRFEPGTGLLTAIVDGKVVADENGNVIARAPDRSRTNGKAPNRVIRIPDELWDRCANSADSRQITRSEWVRQAIEQRLDREQR